MNNKATDSSLWSICALFVLVAEHFCYISNKGLFCFLYLFVLLFSESFLLLKWQLSFLWKKLCFNSESLFRSAWKHFWLLCFSSQTSFRISIDLTFSHYFLLYADIDGRIYVPFELSQINVKLLSSSVNLWMTTFKKK